MQTFIIASGGCHSHDQLLLCRQRRHCPSCQGHNKSDWGGSGGKADSETNSYTYNQYALNYWDIHDLSTDVYDRLDMKFATPVDYDNIHVTVTYSDGTTTESTIVNGATSHNLAFEADKILEKITVSHGLGRSPRPDNHLL